MRSATPIGRDPTFTLLQLGEAFDKNPLHHWVLVQPTRNHRLDDPSVHSLDLLSQPGSTTNEYIYIYIYIYILVNSLQRYARMTSMYCPTEIYLLASTHLHLLQPPIPTYIHLDLYHWVILYFNLRHVFTYCYCNFFYLKWNFRTAHASMRGWVMHPFWNKSLAMLSLSGPKADHTKPNERLIMAN